MGTLIQSCDQDLFKSVAAEVNELAGMLIRYYRLDTENVVRNPTYGEVQEAAYLDTPDGLELSAFVVNPEHATTTGEEGRRTQWDAQLWVARLHWEEKTEATYPPRNGDMVNAWGEWFDVVDTDRDGIMDDERRVYVLWKISLSRKTRYESWRRKDTPP